MLFHHHCHCRLVIGGVAGVAVLGDDVLPGEPDCDLYMSRYVLLLLAAAPQGGSASSDESEDLAQQRHVSTSIVFVLSSGVASTLNFVSAQL